MTDLAQQPGAQDSSPPFISEIRDRIEFIRLSEGFYPTTVDETNRATNLLADPHAGPRHIGEVLRHQVKAREVVIGEIEESLGYHDSSIMDDIEPALDPIEGARRVLWTMGQYAIRARSDKTELLKLSEDVALVTDGQRTVADEQRDIEAGFVEFPHGFGRGLPQFARYISLSRWVLGVEPALDFRDVVRDSDGYVVADLYAAAPNRDDVAAHLDDFYQLLHLGALKRNLGNAILDQHMRERFWYSIIEGVEKKQTQKELVKMAHRILLNLDIAKA